MAVDALKNSETVPWREFKALLEKALQCYEQTPGLEMLYRESNIGKNGLLINKNNR